MANYSELLNDINAAIYENNDQEIDALEVRAILREMVTSLGSGFLFKGIATPSSPSGTGTYEPDQNVFYLATTAGTYTYLGGLVVAAGEVAFLCFDGTWTKKSSALLSTGSIVDNTTTEDATKPLSAKQGKVLADAGAATAAQVSALGHEVSVAIEEQNEEIADFEETITNQIDNYQPIVINGNVTNAPNEEDITTDENDLLKFANRGTLHGMGYIILRRDKTFAEQITLANTIYEIRYDFDLGGASVTIPSGCVLKFVGGSLSGGTLNGSASGIVAAPEKIFDSIVLSGSFSISALFPEWFGAKGDGTTDDSIAIQTAESASNQVGIKLHFSAKTYKVDSTITLGQHSFWEGANLAPVAPSFKQTTIRFATRDSALLQYTGNGTPKNRCFKGICFRSDNISNILFDCGFDDGIVENCRTYQFGIVFNKFVLHCSVIRDCFFTQIANTFIVGNFTDSLITGCYISGYQPMNPKCFGGAVASSRICDNYFDYFKTIVKIASLNFSGSVFSGNTFDFCWKVFDIQFDCAGNSIVGNVFTNIAQSTTSASGFTSPDSEMQALNPAAFFFGSVNASYQEVAIGTRQLSIDFSGNYVDGRVTIIGGKSKNTNIRNSYADISFNSCTIGDRVNDKEEHTFIDFVENRELDSLKTELYDGVSVLHHNVPIYLSVSKSDGAYTQRSLYGRWLNKTGMGALQDNPNPQIQAIVNGWIPTDFFTSSYFLNGVITENGNYERSDYIDLSRFPNGVKIVNGGNAVIVLLVFDATKTQVSSQNMNGGTNVTKTSADGRYIAVWGNFGRLANFHAEAL